MRSTVAAARDFAREAAQLNGGGRAATRGVANARRGGLEELFVKFFFLGQ